MSNVTKQAIKQSFRNYWWIYVVVAVLLCSAWLYAFYLKDKIRDDERLQIFVAGEIWNAAPRHILQRTAY